MEFYFVMKSDAVEKTLLPEDGLYTIFLRQ